MTGPGVSKPRCTSWNVTPVGPIPASVAKPCRFDLLHVAWRETIDEEHEAEAGAEHVVM